jgi:hypothetical protein
MDTVIGERIFETYLAICTRSGLGGDGTINASSSSFRAI